MVLLDNWADANMQNWYNDQAYNEVWGFVEKGQEYAVIGSANGTTILKITDQDKLEQIQFIEGLELNAIHRDYHDYNGYLYEVCDEGASSLRIYDLSYLPDSIHLIYDDNSHIIRSHNIFIDSTSGLLYSCGNTNSFGADAVKVLSLNDPENPTLVYDYNFVNYSHDIYVRNDTAYINAGNEGMKIVDFSSPTMPIALGGITYYIDKGYNHSGWITANASTYLLCDETIGLTFKLLDISDFSNISVLSNTKPTTFDNTVPHNVMIKEGFAYFSYYNDGLQIYDIRNPSSPKRIAYYDTYTVSDISFRGAWGIYIYLPSGRLLVSDRKHGLFLFDYDVPPNLNNASLEMGIYPNPVSNGTAYFYFKQRKNTSFTLSIFDLTGKFIESYQGEDDYLKISSSKYAAGMYVFKYENTITKKKQTGKFIVAPINH